MNDHERSSDRHEQDETDPGAYIGREPERASETIPGGLGPKDERVAAHSTQPSGGEGMDTPPAGHRQGDRASDADVREAGQDG